MAYQKKTTTTANITETKVEDKSKARKYEKDDVIPCKSLTDGKLLVTGEKTGILYRWADYGDVEEIEYQDLVYMIRSHKSCITRPRFIIQDAEFVEQYPELKASENFSKLSQELTKIEDEIANSRKYYNGAVRELNNKIQMFPGNIVAGVFGFKQANMFEANAEERNNVKVSL